MRSEYHAAARMVIASMLARASRRRARCSFTSVGPDHSSNQRQAEQWSASMVAQGKRMKACDPIAGALSGRARAPKPCRTQQRAGSQSRLLTDLRDRWASCVSPGVSPEAARYGHMVVMSIAREQQKAGEIPDGVIASVKQAH